MEKLKSGTGSIFDDLLSNKSGSSTTTIDESEKIKKKKIKILNIKETGAYEINIKMLNSERTIYSNDINFTEDYSGLEVRNFFMKKTLSEVIFLPKDIIVTDVCRVDIEDKNERIALAQSINIRYVPYEQWMDRDEQETQNSFDIKVLETFRKYKNEITAFQNQQVRPIQQPNPQQQNLEDEEFIPAEINKPYSSSGKEKIKKSEIENPNVKRMRDF